MSLMRLINRFYPSRPIGTDPLIDHGDPLQAQRFQPLSIKSLRLTPFIANKLLARRLPVTLEFHPDWRLTVVFPYRNRPDQLRTHLPRIKAYLDAQQIPHQLVVVEQTDGKPFNRGKLLNIGAHLFWQQSDFFAFHDIDMIPLHACYQGCSQPLRLITKMDYTHRTHSEMEQGYFSGVISISKTQFEQANGFSNEYWGWGKEDDDFLFRLLLAGMVPFVDNEGTYIDDDNPADQVVAANVVRKSPNRKRRSLFIRGQIDSSLEGLNSLTFVELDRIETDAYTKVRVEI